MTFNYSTILSSFDKRGTLMKQLQDMENAFNEAGLEDVEVVDETATSLKLKFTFADGSNLTTSAIDIKGAKGDTGNPATVAVGTVSTLPAGSSATVTNSGTASNAVFNFGIPKGDTGEDGGVTTFGGQNGAITLGNGLQMTGKQVSSYDFNLTDTGDVNIGTMTDPRISTFWGTVYKAFNADGTIGKVYGTIMFSVASTITDGAVDLDTGFVVSAPATAYYIYTGCNCMTRGAGEAQVYLPTSLYIDTSGHVYLHWYLTKSANEGKNYLAQIPACIYFFKDFGDTPDNKSIKSFEERMAELKPIDEVR